MPIGWQVFSRRFARPGIELQRRRAQYDDRLRACRVILQERDDPAVWRGRGINAVDRAGFSARPCRVDSASSSVRSRRGKRQQARLVQRVAQPRRVRRSSSVCASPSPNRPTLVRRSAVRWPPTPSGRADVARQRPDVGARRTVHLDVDVDQGVVSSRPEHLEPVDPHPARGQLDRLALAGELVRTLTVHLDRAHRRRHLIDVAAQRAPRPLRWRHRSRGRPEPSAALHLRRPRSKWSARAGWWPHRTCRSR